MPRNFNNRAFKPEERMQRHDGNRRHPQASSPRPQASRPQASQPRPQASQPRPQAFAQQPRTLARTEAVSQALTIRARRTSIGAINSAQPWGLMGDARPPTPSEGRAQYYRRVGPAEQQQTRAWNNGTTLTFGPNDLIPEPVRGAAFDSQFNEVNQAVRDLQLNNGQGGLASNATANSEYRDFRTENRAPHTLPEVRYPDGTTYRMVASQFATVEVIPHVRSLLRHSSEKPGDAHPGDSADTRFGDSHGTAVLQLQQSAEESRREREQRLAELLEAQRSPEDRPIHVSRGTFYPGPTEPGYPPPLLRARFNALCRAPDFGAAPDYQAMGHTSMLDYASDLRQAPNVARHSYGMADYHGHQTGYGRPSTSSNVPNYPHYQGYGSTNIPRPSNTIPQGRQTERDLRYTTGHQQRETQAWARELDERNQVDRRRGGNVDFGEDHEQQNERTPRPAPSFATPRALALMAPPPMFPIAPAAPFPPPPHFLFTEASPLPFRHLPPLSFAAPPTLPLHLPLQPPRHSSAPLSLPPQPFRHSSAPLPNTDRFADSGFSRILNDHDQRRQSSQSPTNAPAPSNSTESTGNQAFVEEADPVRDLSKIGENGSWLYPK